MRIKTLYPAIPTLLICFLFSITAHSQLRKIYLQPKTIARDKQSNYVDSIRFIPLEIKEDIELGAYYNTEITDKYLMIVDYMNKRLVLYKRDGRFVKNIKYNKLGGNFYPSYKEHTNQVVFFGNNKNYALTPKDQIQIRLDWANPHNRKYFKKYIIDLNDSLLAIQKATADEKDIVQASYMYDDYYTQGQIVTSPLYKDSLEYELKLYKNNQFVKAFFPYNHVNEPRYLYTNDFVATHKTDDSHSRIIARPYCDTIYKLVKDSLFPVYKLVLPLENSLPVSFFTKPFKNKVERENFNRNNGWMLHHLYGYYETPRLIVLTIGFLSNYESYIYEKQKDIIYKAKNIKADSSQYNLDLIADPSLQQKGNWFYKSLRAKDITPFFEKNKTVLIPKELEAFLKSKPPDTTPLIVAFKLKN